MVGLHRCERSWLRTGVNDWKSMGPQRAKALECARVGAKTNQFTLQHGKRNVSAQ